MLPTQFETGLPERQDVLVHYPEYFLNPTKEIELQEAATVEVTFLHEGAGYKNVLGYYAYNKNNPPQSLEDLEKIVVFPNASAKNSGGGLIQGQSVALLVEFGANTVIGIFLKANGW